MPKLFKPQLPEPLLLDPIHPNLFCIIKEEKLKGLVSFAESLLISSAHTPFLSLFGVREAGSVHFVVQESGFLLYLLSE